MHRLLLVLLLSAAWLPAATTPPPGSGKIHQPVLLLVEASAKEIYDDNIYTYAYGRQADRSSWITQGQLTLGLKCDADQAGTWTPSYTWEGLAFLNASEESHQKHTGRLEFAGKQEDWSWQGDLSQSYTDGSTISPTWTGPGGAPAVGAPEVRNRRRNFMLDHNAQITWKPGAWWVRGLYRGQWHDFMTDYSPTPGYQNYDDRNDFSLGLDFGRQLAGDWDAYVGGRLGQEDQGQMPHTPIEFDNQYFRWVVGTLGHPLPWLNIDAEAGPDFRFFTRDLPKGEPDERTEIYYRGQVGIQITSQDLLSLSGKQYLFPSSAGCGMMREGLWDAEFRHTFTGGESGELVCSASLGFRVNEDDFFPAKRRDRVYTPRLEWKTAWKQVWNLRATYEYSWSESEVVNTPSREFERSRISVAASWRY
ncbi:MAG: hypothetical protein SFU85_09325 [Candidatus Methylacidiphilales bacterium]|nr:hypothetical protein [Candidatus Methylacidiphilales bacterium]